MIKDKVVIITGASSGIGEATANKLAHDGAKVVLGARNTDKLSKIANEITEAGGQAVYQKTDVTKREDSQKLVDFAKDKFGHVDVIYLNAGVMPNSPLSELRVEDWDLMIDVNLKGVLYGIAAILPEFRKQHSGQIIATSSVAGIKAYPGGAVYGATKWGVKDLMEVLRMECAQNNEHIRTSVIYPAAVHSNLTSHIPDKKVAQGEAEVRAQTELSADKVANVVAFAIDTPEDTTVNEFTVGPADQAW